ncbi:hypothetical protein B6D60_07025 [candidate division KSB1 bacterium 4484_87]|nr:MAG: hypothetical protein B6D60_07025 [candidate division KSB1 bacterium 4484_87]
MEKISFKKNPNGKVPSQKSKAYLKHSEFLTIKILTDSALTKIVLKKIISINLIKIQFNSRFRIKFYLIRPPFSFNLTYYFLIKLIEISSLKSTILKLILKSKVPFSSKKDM